MNDNPFQKLSSKIVYQNPWIRIHEDDIVHPDGSNGIYGYMESKDSVQIVALNDKQEVYLVKSFRYPSATWGWELPGGGKDDGESDLQGAKRELAEETGIVAAQWNSLGKPLVCNGLMTERQTVYVAQDLTIGERHQADDADTITEGKFVSFEEIDTMVRTGEIGDTMTLGCLFLAEHWLRAQ